MKWFKKIFKKRKLVPLNFGQEDCAEIKRGDTLIGILEEDCYDYIAGLCRMDPKIDKGLEVRWKVVDISERGTVFIKSGSNTSSLNYLTWDDGNRVTVPKTLAGSEKKIRFFKENWVSRRQAKQLALSVSMWLLSITAMAQPPCPPFSACWCQDHPGHPQCSSVQVPIDTHVWILLAAGIGLGVYALVKSKKLKTHEE